MSGCEAKSVSGDHSEDGLPATVVTSVLHNRGRACSRIFSHSSVLQMSRGMGRSQPGKVMTTSACLATHKLQVQQTDR